MVTTAQDVEEKYSAIASSSQELQRLQVQQHTSDTAVNTNQTVLQREHRTHFEECQPQIHSIRVHRCDFKVSLLLQHVASSVGLKVARPLEAMQYLFTFYIEIQMRYRYCRLS